ncbi:putative permease [Methanosarcina horonobensis HB-1 = JCM 15518]|uniref:Putative permease n=3 Tax=Methanosarcina horonobensis TaxID=418008 RepID=A0A0E3SH61_9EURY|nr:putative permease [Methanosarcina horonobensis HB-1 = JCM 15518]
MSLIASDIMRFFKNPLLALSLLGFLFSVPTMCYILAYVIFIPIAKELSSRLNYPSISTATALALGAVASFNLVYPSPVIISAAEELSAYKDTLIILGFLIAVPTSTAGYLYARKLEKIETTRIFKNNSQGKFQMGFPETGFIEVAETSQQSGAGVIQRKAVETKVVEAKAVEARVVEAEAVRAEGIEVKKNDKVQIEDTVKSRETGKPGRFEAYAPIFLPLLLLSSFASHSVSGWL